MPQIYAMNRLWYRDGDVLRAAVTAHRRFDAIHKAVDLIACKGPGSDANRRQDVWTGFRAASAWHPPVAGNVVRA
jgi:hypothetical protein